MEWPFLLFVTIKFGTCHADELWNQPAASDAAVTHGAAPVQWESSQVYAEVQQSCRNEVFVGLCSDRSTVSIINQ